MTSTPVSLASPLPLPRGPALKNRFMLAPLTNFQSQPDGCLGEDEYLWLIKRAEADFGLTMTCAAYVQDNGAGFPGQLGISAERHAAGLARLAQGIRRAGSVSAVQLQHSGLRAKPALTGQTAVAPWDDAETGARALTTAEVEQLVQDFVAAAVRAEAAGFDGVELHGAHGYLLAQFLDAERNRRTDGYGGSFENRCRILFEIIDGVRRRTAAQFQLGLRLSPERFGVRMPEALELASQVMVEGKLDYLDMSLWDCFKPPQDPAYAAKPLIDWFAALPRGHTRMGVAGKLMGAAAAQACLDHGADFVLIGRGAILHHDFVRQALADPAFQSVKRPVSRAYLQAQAVGPAFIHYLATEWRDFVAD